MATPYDHIPDEIKKEAAASSDPSPRRKAKPDVKAPPAASVKREIPPEERQRRLFKRTRANTELTRTEVQEIKDGRKKLRAEMRAQRIYTKKEFELLASSLGLYFDKRRPFAFFTWFFHGKGLLALLGAALLLMFLLAVLSWAVQMRGHFTVNMSESLFEAGFVLSETEDFAQPTTHLFSAPAENIPCVSISDIPVTVDQTDGSHNGDYFAYTFYVRNEGDRTVGYEWSINFNSESKDVSSAAWIIVFEDGAGRIFAEESASGGEEALPGRDDTRRGYPNPGLLELMESAEQFELLRQAGEVAYYRVIPYMFESPVTLASGTQTGVLPDEVHKYTVVMWLEGDDPQCTDDLIGGHLGMEMSIRLLGEEQEEEKETWFDRFLGDLLWWNTD